MRDAGPVEMEGELSPTGSVISQTYCTRGIESVRCGTKCHTLQTLGYPYGLIRSGEREGKTGPGAQGGAVAF